LFANSREQRPATATEQGRKSPSWTIEVRIVPELPTSSLPLLNAVLNGIATILLVTGYIAIRRGRIAAHRASMIAAFATSVLFLASYLIYHANEGSRPFPGRGAIRTVYFTVLISHIVLAAAVPLLAGLTLWRALRGDFGRHVPIARRTLPIWLYVSVTGLVVYWMLYRMY
jgi:uncharacterized membrane protein YozB (DUF420 family)